MSQTVITKMADGDDDKIHDGPLVPWERREYRQYRTTWIKMANQYTFSKQMYRVLAYAVGYTTGMVTTVWIARDYIWAIIKGVVTALSTMP